MSFDPYLNFNGTCKEAMTFYTRVFGGTLSIQHFRNMPDAPPEFAEHDGVIHAVLVLGDRVLMASDLPPGYEGGVSQGINISHTARDADHAHQLFDALADGGSVMMPLSQTFGSPLFGMLTNRFGINWMIGLEQMPS